MVGAPPLELSSLVDVAFLLLAFFLLTSTIDPREADLGFQVSPIPEIFTEATAGVQPEPCVVELDAIGEVWCDGERVGIPGQPGDLDGLRAKLEEVHAVNRMTAGGPALVVVVRAADEAKGQRFVDVMNCLAEMEIDSVRLEGFLD